MSGGEKGSTSAPLNQFHKCGRREMPIKIGEVARKAETLDRRRYDDSTTRKLFD